MMMLLGLLFGCSGQPDVVPSDRTRPIQVVTTPPATMVPEPSAAHITDALNRAAGWAEAYPHARHFDATLMAWSVASLSDNAAWKQLDTRLRSELNDTDHEHIKLWTPTYQLPKEYVHRWTGPAEGRANVNRVLTEALFCNDHGWREQTTTYVCGPMRDDGGYHTTHGLWALTIAHQRGCVDQSCRDSLVAELLSHQPSSDALIATLDLDLYAERLLTVALANHCVPTLATWADTLLQHQSSDGSWGVDAVEENPYYRYHATSVSAWALSAWQHHCGQKDSHL
jgi:hypothetical protein